MTTISVSSLDDLKLVLPNAISTPLPVSKINKIRVHHSGKFIAINFSFKNDKIFIFSEPIGDACELIQVLNLDSPSDFAFSPTADLLAVVTNRGDACMYDLSSPSRFTRIQFDRFISASFSAVTFSKDGEMLVIVSDSQLVVVEKREKIWKQTKPVLDFAHSDFVTDIAIHPEKCAVAVASTNERGILIVGIPGYKIQVQEILRVKPIEHERGVAASPLASPCGQSKHLNPNILNFIPSRGFPIACVWSPYGEMLAIGTSDNLITLWNISASSCETLALDEGIVIREIFFIADSVLVVVPSDDSKIICINIDDGVMFENDLGGAKTLCGGDLRRGVVYRPRGRDVISRFKLTV